MKSSIPFTIFSVLALALTCFLAAPASAGWGEEALALQEHLDINAPFTHSMWVGTHNSYNADQWDEAYTADPNQYYTISEQLDMGARELTFDIYDVYEILGVSELGDLVDDILEELGGNVDQIEELLMCHGECSLTEKSFEEGLEEIRDWIDDDHLESVILLKLEIEVSFDKAGEVLEEVLGDYIYKPTAGVLSESSNPDGCYGLEAEFLSKAEVLKAGKNVVVITTPLGGCPDDNTFEEWVHVGFEYQDYGYENKFDKPTALEDCIDSYANGKMSRVHDGNTFTNVLGIADGVQYILEVGEEDHGEDKYSVADYLSCGLNVFELFNFGGKKNGTLFNTDFDGLEPEDLVWSWDTNKPDGSGDCAQLVRSSERFQDASCESSYEFACYDALNDAWEVTVGSAGPWDDGHDLCSETFGAAYRFAVPTSNVQKEDLLDHAEFGTRVWVNYHDQSFEGLWQANSVVELDVATNGSWGGDEGSAFDDLHLLERSLLLGGEPLHVTSVRMRSGERIDALEVTYSDGTTLHRGGNGGGWGDSLELSEDEAIWDYSICWDKENGSDRVTYLELETNYGNVVSGGDRSGFCTERNGSRPVRAFFGRSGNELDALGFYRAAIERQDSIDMFAINWSGSAQGGNLYRIDTDSVESTDSVSISGNHTCVSDLAFQPGTGTLFAVNCNGFQGAGSTLMTIDPETGVATTIGALHGDRTAATSIAFHPDEPDHLYAINRSGINWGKVLFTIDVTDGSTTQLGFLNGDRTHATSIAFNTFGALYAINNEYTGGSGKVLYTIDVDTQQTTEVGYLNGDRTEATSIRFDQNNTLYGINSHDYQGSGRVLYKIDTLDASTTEVGFLNGDHYYATSMAIRR